MKRRCPVIPINKKKFNMPKGQTRSFAVILLIHILVFLCFVVLLLVYNTRLQKLLDIQTLANELVDSWNKTENLNQELLITYQIDDISKKWNDAIDRFDADFDAFLAALSEQRKLTDDLDLKIKVAKIEMHWSVVQKRLGDAQAMLKRYMANVDTRSHEGNLLVDFGQALSCKTFDANSIDLLEKLRWTTSLSRYAFKNALIDVTQYVTRGVQQEVTRIKTTSILLSALILTAAGIFIFIRMVEMARSREDATRHAEELSVKIQERDHVERLLRTEKEKLQSIINAMGVGLYVVNREGMIEFQSQRIAQKFPMGEGRICYETYMDQDRPCPFCLSQAVIDSGKLKQVETVESNGRHLEYIFSPFVDIDKETKNIVMIRDITVKKQLAAEAARAGYLSSIGELAAGVAHEINNPINGIISLAELIQDDDSDGEVTEEATKRIIREGVRVAGIVSNLLSFARDRKDEADAADVRDVLSDALDLVGMQIRKEGTALLVSLQSPLPKVKVVKQELQQVFLNLLSNSRYALNGKYPGPHRNKKIAISGMSLKAQRGTTVRLIFQDSGVGIDDAVLDKVGLPFYSTKPPGEGTGLGLSISRNIIEKFGGTFFIESEFGKFTTVTIELPGVLEQS